MSDYRLMIEEIKDSEVITSYTRWVDAVQVRGAENLEIYLTFSPRGIGTGSNKQPPFVRDSGLFKNWRHAGNDWEVTDFGIGQEFLIDSNLFPGALCWAQSLF
jgi:hypothetical protein